MNARAILQRLKKQRRLALALALLVLVYLALRALLTSLARENGLISLSEPPSFGLIGLALLVVMLRLVVLFVLPPVVLSCLVRLVDTDSDAPASRAPPHGPHPRA